MGALLESGMVGNIGLKHLRVIKEDTIKKWDELGFLEGLVGHQKDNIAQLYENEASFLINEAAVSDSSGSFETVVFPIIRRVFSKLLANDIVSVQAMNLPIGKLFFFVPKIQDRNSGSHYAPYGYPNTTDAQTAGYSDTARNLYDRFYESGDGNAPETGLFDYSKGKYILSGVTGSNFITFSNGAITTYATVAAAGLTGSTVHSVVVSFTGFATDGQGKLIGPNGSVMDTEEFLASATIYDTLNAVYRNFNIVTQKYGKGIVEYGQKSTATSYPTGRYQDICDEGGTIYINIDLDTYSSTSGFSGLAIAATGTTAASNFILNFRVYDTLEFEEEIGEVSFDLSSVTVSVTERKLRASWSPELAQDVSAFHNIDAEAELTALLSEQIAAEVDREILRDLRKGAAWHAKWDWNEWKYGNAGSAFMGYTQKDWNQTLVTKINQLSAQIHKTTLRGGANWIVISSEVSAVFDDLEYFHVSNAAPEQDQYNMGIEKIGTLAGRYQVYRDPYFPPNKVLIGHKGKSLLDAGYVYAPYVPLQLTPTMYNPFNMTPIKGIMTRYAKKMVNNRYFGVIDVKGIVTFDLDSLR
jgi:hypothetical protein